MLLGKTAFSNGTGRVKTYTLHCTAHTGRWLLIFASSLSIQVKSSQMWERQETMIWNAIQSFEQTKVANKDSASKMRGGLSLQRIVVSVILNSQLSAVSQSLTPNSQISVLNSQIKLSSQFPSPDSQIPKSQFSASNSQFPVLTMRAPKSKHPILSSS